MNIKITAIAFFLVATVSAQTNNFSLESPGELIWQHVFETKIDPGEVLNSFKLSVMTNISADNLQEMDNKISFSVEGDKINIQKYGAKWGNTAIFAQYPFDYLAVIEFKENRYRVTLRSINIDFSAAGMGSSMLGETVTRKQGSEISQGKAISKGLDLFNLHFLDSYAIKNIKKDDDDW